MVQPLISLDHPSNHDPYCQRFRLVCRYVLVQYIRDTIECDTRRCILINNRNNNSNNNDEPFYFDNGRTIFHFIYKVKKKEKKRTNVSPVKYCVFRIVICVRHYTSWRGGGGKRQIDRRKWKCRRRVVNIYPLLYF